MVCFRFGNPEGGEKIKRRTGLKHTRNLGNVYTTNIFKIQKNRKQPLFSTEKFACISIRCTFLNSGYQKRWKAVLYHFKSMIEKYVYSCFKYKNMFYPLYLSFHFTSIDRQGSYYECLKYCLVCNSGCCADEEFSVASLLQRMCWQRILFSLRHLPFLLFLKMHF